MLSDSTSRTTEPARLRPAETQEMHTEKPTGAANGVGDALLTCLLAIYPAVATLGVIVAGLFFSGASGGA